MSQPSTDARIPLRRRDGSIAAWAVVDPDQLADLGQFSWALDASRGYVYRGFTRREKRHREYLHRRLLGLVPGDGVYGDHINGDKLDNRRANLRVATPQQSAQNTKTRSGTSSYRGVFWCPVRYSWLARATLGGIQHDLGAYALEEDAAAVSAAFRERHMPFAVAR